MSQTLHQIYQSKAIVVTRTMVIKFHKIAEAINADVRRQGYEVDENNPASWKYYMNMFGEYHISDRARLLELSNGQYDSIRIKVAGETQPVEVNFNKANISGANGDVAIANEYRFNTFYFNELVDRYPEFEDLILGVLNPISPDISTIAKEGEILYCGGYVKTLLPTGIYHYVRQDYGIINDNYLIEPNEENLISKLQTHIDNFLERWWNAGYGVTSNLFLTTFIGMLYLSIPQILGNIRLGNAKTPFAHSFHIREHLESWGGLGWVTEYLSKGVLLWLYRNMVWLNANRGKAKVLDSIIENVLTPTNIPITGFRLRHDVEEMDEDVLTATPFMEQYKLNFAKNSSPVRNEIIDIINAELSLATENHYDREGQAKDVSDRSKFSMFDNLNTKVLESTVIDDSNKVPVTLEDIALNLWCFAASRGDYRGTVIFTNPVNNERIQLTPLNAYILSFYCLNRGWANYTFEDIPTMYARLIHRHPTHTPGPEHPVKPKLEDVSKGVVKPFITNAEIENVLGTYVPTYKHNSTTSFGREVELAHAESLRKYSAYARIDDAQGRGYGEWVAHKCYWYNVKCPLTATPTKYKDWLMVQGLDIEDYSRQEFVELGLKIVEAAVGVNIHRSDEIRNRQSSVLAILKHFASYTVQIIQNTVASDSYWLDWKHTRLTNFKSKASGSIKAQLPMYTVVTHWSIKDGVLQLNLYTGAEYRIKKETLASKENTTLTFPTVSKIKQKDTARYKFPTFTIVSMVIPEVIVEKTNRIYSYLTTVPYPYGSTERVLVNAKIISDLSISKPLQKEIETINARAKLIGQMQLLTPSLLGDELVTAQARIISMTLATVSTRPTEVVNVKSKVIGEITLIKPMIVVRDEVGAKAEMLTMGLGATRIEDENTITAKAAIVGDMYLLMSRPESVETVAVNAEIVNITMITLPNETAEQINVSATVTGAFELTPPLVPSDETLSASAGVANSMELIKPLVLTSDSIEVTANILSLTLHPSE